MSDINLTLHGIVAFLAAAALSLLLVVGLVICAALGLTKARQRKERLVDQRIFPHLFGMSLGLFCSLAITLLILFSDSLPQGRAFNRSLDEWVFVWVLAILALWPLGALIWKRLKPVRSKTET